MDEEKFDFENLKVYQKVLEYMDSNLRIPVGNGFKPFPTELRTIFQRKNSLDEILSTITLSEPPASPQKVLFWGEGTGEVSSYVAGWMAGQGIDVIVLDGANRFNPYRVSSFARKALVSPENLLKRIRIARAFTCYQMAALIGKKLPELIGQEGGGLPDLFSSPSGWGRSRVGVILLGPITTFLDENVPEREIRPLFERSLKRVEEMVEEGIPLFLFQPLVPAHSKRGYLMRRLFHFSNLIWRINLDDQGTKIVLEKGLIKHSGIMDFGLQIVNPKFQITNPK